ncbi:MAG: hypothetical protein ACI8ZX_000612 [Planctomycetota bacterium]|jgi:hypothetical protein
MAVFWNMVKRKDFSLRTCQLKLVVFIYSFFLVISTTSAQGNLLIFPKRIVLDGGKRVKQLIKNNINELVDENKFLVRESDSMAKIGYWTYDKQIQQDGLQRCIKFLEQTLKMQYLN